MLVVGPDLQREAVATNSSFAKYRFSDGRDLLLEILGQGEIARCTRYDDEEDWAGGHLDSERLPNIKPHEGLCDGRHQVLREVAHGGQQRFEPWQPIPSVSEYAVRCRHLLHAGPACCEDLQAQVDQSLGTATPRGGWAGSPQWDVLAGSGAGAAWGTAVGRATCGLSAIAFASRYSETSFQSPNATRARTRRTRRQPSTPIKEISPAF